MSSSSITPLWGPQLPRIPRSRQVRWEADNADGWYQSRNGITHVEDDPIPSHPRSAKFCLERCVDTKRNPKFAPFKPKNFFDDGGPLTITKSLWQFNDPAKGVITPWVGNTRAKYGLSVVIGAINDGGFNPTSETPPSSDADFSSWHAQAYKAMRPDRPGVDLFTAFAEIRDLVHLNFQRIRDIKDLSNWWLQTEFGWKPLLSDILKMIKLQDRFSKRLQFLIDNDGLPVRRRVDLNESTARVDLVRNTNIGLTRNTYVDWPGRTSRSSSWQYSVTRDLEKKVWASGCFVFYLRDLKIPQNLQTLKTGLWGLNPTPAAIWNALPWSWLIDWVSNVGDILDNMSNAQIAERLVAVYGYVMGTTTRTYRWEGTDGWYYGSAEHKYVTKSRSAIHPYGLAFGSALSPTQMSILASLMAQRF